MCRNIRPLYNFEPPASADEIRAASLQFVRKVSGTNRPSKVNEPAFDRAVDDIAEVVGRLLGALTTAGKPRNREAVAARARAAALERFAER